MSQLLDKPTTSKVTASPRRKPQVKSPLPSTTPDITLKARVYERKRSKPGIGSLVLQKLGLFAVVMGVTYGAASLTGQVMVESARQDRLEAHSRAAEAQKAESLLSVKVDQLSNSATIDAYAMAVNMTPSGEAVAKPAKEARVALR